MYSSLSNAIDVSTNGTLQLGNLGAGSNSMITSIFAGGIAKAGTYSFTAGVGDKESELTLSTVIDGKSKVQTIKLADSTLGSSQNLNFDQLIAEFPENSNPAWVHVSYESTGKQRKQILVAKKVGGATKYIPYKSDADLK